MAEYVALEKSIYETIRSKPFTSMPNKPTWAQKNYCGRDGTNWVGNECAIHMGQGLWTPCQKYTVQLSTYLSNTGHNYVAPTQPPNMDPDMLIPGKTQIQIKIM